MPIQALQKLILIWGKKGNQVHLRIKAYFLIMQKRQYRQTAYKMLIDHG